MVRSCNRPNLEVSSFEGIAPEGRDDGVNTGSSEFIVQARVGDLRFGIGLRAIELVNSIASSSSTDAAFIDWLPCVDGVEHVTSVGEIQVVSVLELTSSVGVQVQ
eukprot:TRINITY_DN1257_c0_g1_i1.p1 TRINITY_DN1257_c0_g1~~TRINITY_DN1257_c0_g1_i1.p1  ORF type:complete len:105 (+),score=7.91 TRINITY_DN1257_c0_g1_i1:514-828(+)